MIAARWRSAILRSAFALRTAIVAAVFLSADVFTPTPIFAAEDESSVGGESLILAPSPSLAELGDESFHSLISPTANTAIADTDLLLRHRDSWRRRLGLRTQSAMESLVGTPALADAMRRLESGDLLLKDFSHRAGNVFFNAAADFSANEIQRLAGLDSIVKRIEIGYDSPLGQHDGSGRADIFLSLWEDHNTLLFGQIGGILQERDNRWEPGGNVGLGLRFQAGAIIFGGNAFFDYLNDDNPGEFRRYSVGLEALTSHADWSINTYRRISDVATKTTNAGTFIVYTAEGWDSEIALRIPGAEWLELAARRYEWERERSGKLVGFDYRLSFLLLESFSLDATFDAPEDGDSDWGVNARFHFDLTDGFRFRRASAESLTDPWHRRYESVRRRYEQRIIEEITILPTPAMCDAESDTVTCDLPLPLLNERLRVRGATSALSANQSGATSALSAQSGATSALSANDFEPNARTCDDSGVCEWRITTVASAGELTAGEIDCVINRNNNGCRIALTLSPPPALLTQGSIRVEITEAGGFTPPSAPLILDMANFFEVEFSSASAAAFAEGNKISVSVSANIARNEDTIITVSLVAGTAATPNTDYRLLDLSDDALTCDGNNCAITLTANATVASFQITALANTPDELAEAFSLMLIEGISVYALGAQTTFTSTIASDIGGGEAAVQFTAATLAALDEGSVADITVQANAIRNTPTTVTILLVAGTTATPDNPATPAFDGDYRLLNSSGVTLSCDGNNNCAITIAANAQNEIIQVTALAEGDFENVEAFSLMLIDGSDYELDTSQTTFTGMINNRDGVPIIRFTANSLGSPLDEDSTAEVIVQADGPVPNATIVTISLVADTTATPITDYQLLVSSGLATIACDTNNLCAITISAGAMMESFRISARTDTTAELTEAFSLMLIEDTGVYALGNPNSLTGEIASDLPGGVNQASMEFSAANLAALDEGSVATITVQANAVRSTPTTVTILLVAAVDTATDATPITDYQLLNSSGNPLTCVGINNCAITIAASVTVEVIRITAIEDGIFENVESFTLSLVLGTDYAVGSQDTFGGNINNRDGTPIVEFTAASVGALAEGDTANVIVQTTTPAAPVPDATIVTISLVADTTATPGTDYQLLDSQSPPAIIACGSNNLCAITISAGAMMEQIQVTVTDESIDPIPELTEAFSLMLIDEGDITYDLGTQASFGGEITGDIAGTEASVQFSAANLAATLEEGGTALDITVQANAVRNTPTIVTISVGVTGNTATPDDPATPDDSDGDYRLLDSDGTPLACDSNNRCAITLDAAAQIEQIQITARLDGDFENVQSFSLVLIRGDDYALSAQRTTFTGMISSTDGVPIIQFTADALGSPLAEDSTANIVVRANVIVSTPLTITISLGLAADAATPDTDYQLLNSGGTVISCVTNNCAITISAGAMMEQIQITARADSPAELAEAFSLTLVDTNDYNLGGRDVFTGMISNVGGIAAMRFSAANITTPIAEGSSAVVAVRTDTPVGTPTIITISLVAGTAATPGTDYELFDSGTTPTGISCDSNNLCAITLSANMMVEEIRISATADSTVELAEAFSLMLIEHSGVYALGTPDSLAGAIASDVAGGVASMEFTATNLAATLEENGAAVPITVQANAVRSTPTIVTISLVADPTGARRNLPDRDYQLLISTGTTPLACNGNNCAITISANMTVEVIQITALANTPVELAEAFSLTLIRGSDYELGAQRTSFAGEIASDLAGGVNEASMQFSATGLAALAEGGNADIIVQANAVRTTPTTVTILLVAGTDPTDATPITDYQLLISTGASALACNGNNCAITISANAMMEQIQITAIEDAAFENVEAFSLMLINGDGYTLGSPTTFGGMISSIDGTPIIQFVGDSLGAPLRESIAEPITVQATATVAAPTVVTVSLGVTGDTATPGTDYQLLNSGGTVISCVSNNCAITISAGMTDEIIQVMAIADTVTEAVDEPFSLSLVDDGGPGGGNYDLVSSQDTFTGTITDSGGVHFSTASVNTFASIFGDEGSSIDFTVETDTAFDANTVVTVSLGVTADTATPGTDYVLRDSSGMTITCDSNNCDLTIPMDVTTASFQFFAIDDSTTEAPELPESFSLMLVGDGSVYEVVSPDTLEGEIESDLGPGVTEASMEFSAAGLAASLSEGGTAPITVQANAVRSTPTIVTIAIAAGNAAIFGPDTNSDADYQLLNSASSPTALTCVNNNCAITISAGVTVEVIQITAHANTTVELAEEFSLMLIAGSDYALDMQTTFTDVVTSDIGDAEASMQFSTATLTDNLDEGTTASSTNLDVVANAVRTTPTIVTISLVAAVDTATDATPITDYQLLNSASPPTPLTCDGNNNCAITISANAMMERIQITAHLDGIFENVESFTLSLIDGSDYDLVFSPDEFTGTIDNRDGTPTVQFTAASVGALAEGDTADVTVQVATAPVFADTVVTISLVAGTTATPGTDYQLLVSSGLATIACVNNNCAITISAGAMMEQIQVTVTDESTDPIPELTEAFSLMLVGGVSVYEVGTQASFGGEITGDIAGTEASVEFETANFALSEGNTTLLGGVRANAVRNTPTIVTISVVSPNTGDAIFNSDYQLLNPDSTPLTCDGNNNCAITIAANAQNGEIQIAVIADLAFEPVESFSLVLVDGGGYALSAQRTTFTGMINSIDGTPIIRLVAASLTGVTEGNAISITVQAIAPITLDIIVTISLGVDTDSTTDDATPMTDYRLFDSDGVTPLTCDTDNLCAITISADETDEVIQIMAITDSDTEEDESFLLTLIDEGDTTYDLVTDNALLVFAGTINAIARVQFSTANLATPIAEGFTSATTSPNLAVSTSAPVESPITITIALVPPVNDAFATPDDPARAGFDGDYALLNSVGVALTCTGNNCLITIAMGEMMAPFQITAIDDASGAGTELAEPFRLTLIDGVTYNLATPDSLTGEIASNVPDGEARMQFSPAALVSNLDEGTTFANIVVRANFPRSTPTIVTISVGVTGNTATPDDPAMPDDSDGDFDGDYRLLDSDGTPLACDSNNRCAITLDAAARTETFQIIARMDGDFENVQSFSLVLIDGGDYELGSPTTFTGNIDNEDGTPIIQFAAASLTENLAEGSAAEVIVQTTDPTAPVLVDTVVTISLVAAADATTDATPDAPDADYQLLDTRGTTPATITCNTNNLCAITITAGATEEIIQVMAISDAQVTEPDESFSLRLIDDSDPTPTYNLGTQDTFTGTIDNVGIAIVQFSTANLGAITEGDSVEFEVTSLAAVSTPTIITISLVAATDATDATPITDYVLLNSVGVTIICDDDNLCDITLPANEGEVMIQVMAISGDAGELAESFSLVLIDGDDYNLESPATSTSSGTIAANPRIVLTAGTATAGERFEITMTFEPPIADFSSAGFGGAGAAVNMQIRGYDDVTDFTNISPSNFNVSSANTNSSTIRGLRARFSITSIRLANPTIVAIMLDDGISSDTIEIRISGTGGGLVGQYDISQILSVTIP